VDATIGGLSIIVQSFSVAINAKGGDCWHVYRNSGLVIDGKNNSEDGTGKKSSEDGILAAMMANRKAENEKARDR
jgi:hypothetical protein